MKPKIFVATKAFILYNDKVLILRESSKYEDGSKTGQYDLVGGRINPGENIDECTLREIKEETGLKIKIGKPFFVNESWPKVRGEQWQIIRIFFECISETNEVILSEEHDHYEWIDPKDYKKYNVIDNLFPAFEEHLSNNKR